MKLQHARAMALALLDTHGLSDWHFAFDHARRRFGTCDYGQKRITLSRHLTNLNDEAHVRDTLLHEIAHALTPGHGHDAIWKATCRKLGATPTRCYDASVVRQPPARYLLVCRHCGMQVPRFRKSNRKLACKVCCQRHNNGTYSNRFTLHWTDNPNYEHS